MLLGESMHIMGAMAGSDDAKGCVIYQMAKINGNTGKMTTETHGNVRNTSNVSKQNVSKTCLECVLLMASTSRRWCGGNCSHMFYLSC